VAEYSFTLTASGVTSSKKFIIGPACWLRAALLVNTVLSDFMVTRNPSITFAQFSAPGASGFELETLICIGSGNVISGLNIPIIEAEPLWFSTNGAGRCCLILSDTAE